MRLPDNIRLLRRCSVVRDPHTTLTHLHVEVGDPAWEWRRAMIHAEPAPACAADPRLRARFRDVLGRWMQIQHRNVQQVYDVVDDDPPYAMLEFDQGPTLASLCSELSARGRPLPGRIAGTAIGQLEDAHRELAAAGLAHGFWSAHVLVTWGGLKLVPRAWWDERLTPAGDRRLLDALTESLLALTADGARPPETLEGSGALWKLARELCGVPAP